MKKSYAVACILMLLALPDSVLGQEPSQAIRARPEHMRAVIPLDDLKFYEPVFTARVTPGKLRSFDVETDALPSGSAPHSLTLARISRLQHWYTDSVTAWLSRSGLVSMAFSLVQDQLYVLEIRVRKLDGPYSPLGNEVQLTLELDSPGPLATPSSGNCFIDNQASQKKLFTVPESDKQLLAIISRNNSIPSDDICVFSLQESPAAPDDGSWEARWVFYSAQITRLATQ